MIITTISLGLGFIALERFFPARILPKVSGWWPRVVLLNLLQLGAVLAGGLLWQRYLGGISLFPGLFDTWSPIASGALGYFISSFFYYWWHRWRHEADVLWRFCHQLHHSPTRIETVTAFYKHPLEFLANVLLSNAISYLLLGLSLEAAAWVTLFSALGEFVYHVNIRTPRWLGYIFQRPEMHRIHHELGKHQKNYGDFPIWDMLFGTYENPDPKDPNRDVACGFEDDKETLFLPMLAGQDVHRMNPNASPQISQETAANVRRSKEWLRQGAMIVLVLVGSLQLFGWAVGSPALRGLGFMSAASPLPLVFSQVRGVETFAQDFHVSGVGNITPERYGKLGGPYQRRNTYGAAFSYGPSFDEPKAIGMMESVFRYGLCDGPLSQAIAADEETSAAKAFREKVVTITSKTQGQTRLWRHQVECQ